MRNGLTGTTDATTGAGHDLHELDITLPGPNVLDQLLSLGQTVHHSHLDLA